MAIKRKMLLLTVFLYVIGYIYFSYVNFKHYDSIDYVDLIIESMLIILSSILLIAFQFFKGPHKTYSLLTIGLVIFLLAHVSDVMDEVCHYPVYITFLIDDLSHLLAIVFVLLGFSRWLKYNNNMVTKLQKLATIDTITSISNRQHIQEILEKQITNVKRYNRDISIVLIDIDHFKEVNDNYGHDVGDLVLSVFSEVVSAEIRETDYFGRYGGEEFLLVLPETDLEGATAVAEKVRAALVVNDFGDVPNVTASFGVACRTKGENRQDLIKRSDIAMYESKKNGRNRVSVSKLKPHKYRDRNKHWNRYEVVY